MLPRKRPRADKYVCCVRDTLGDCGPLGITFSMSEGRVTVQQIKPRSPASRTEMQAGDMLEAINGLVVIQASLDQVVNIIKACEGKLEFRMKRGSRTTTALIATSGIENIPVPPSLAPSGAQAVAVQQLQQMGFKQSESIQACEIFGFNIEAAMVWLVQQREERQFESELAQASVLSEDGKEREVLLRAKTEAENAASAALCTLFPDSIMLEPTQNVCNTLRKMAKDAKATGINEAAAALRVGQIQSNCSSSKGTIRQLLLKLLKLEKQSLKWYEGEAAKAYMAQRRSFLISCVDVGEEFHIHIQNEIHALEEALFSMPDVAGGAPKAFIQALTNSAEHSLQVDGVEEIEVPEAEKIDTEESPISIIE